MSRNIYGGPDGQEKADFYVLIGIIIAVVYVALKLFGVI
jgi:hypothetical protein